MKVLCHHIYEYEKGLRSLVLHTMSKEMLETAAAKLNAHNIHFTVREMGSKVNIFFGAPECVAIIDSFGDKPLNHFSDEEDFILGIMLGYGRLKQCERYIKRKKCENLLITIKNGDGSREEIAL